MLDAEKAEAQAEAEKAFRKWLKANPDADPDDYEPQAEIVDSDTVSL